MPERLTQKCANCRYFQKQTEADGQCRRFPPNMWTDKSLTMMLHEWCGEWALHPHIERIRDEGNANIVGEPP